MNHIDIKRVIRKTVDGAESVVRKVRDMAKRTPVAVTTATRSPSSSNVGAVSLVVSHPVEAEPEQVEVHYEPEPVAVPVAAPVPVYVPAVQAPVQVAPVEKKGWGMF